MLLKFLQLNNQTDDGTIALHHMLLLQEVPSYQVLQHTIIFTCRMDYYNSARVY